MIASVLFALAAALAWGVSDFLGGLYTRRLTLLQVMLISQVVGFGLLVVIAGLLGPPALDGRSIGFAMAASAAGLVGIAALYRGMATGVVSIVAPISATGAAVPVLFGLVRGEQVSALQLLGIGLALVGIVLAASASGSQASGPNPENAARGLRLALLAALGFGAFFVLLHEASTRDVLWAGVVQRSTGLVIIGLAALARRTPLAVGASRLPALVTVGVLDTGANVLYAYGSTTGLVSLAAVLASLYPVVTVLLARVVLAERLAPVQAVGVVCALGGVALITSR